MSSSTRTRTPADLIAAVRELATEFPSAVYQSQPGDGCLYDEGKVLRGPQEEGCLLGQAIRKIGVSTDGMVEAISSELIPARFGYDFIAELTERQERWLLFVQEAQDTGALWGDAVKGADGVWSNV